MLQIKKLNNLDFFYNNCQFLKTFQLSLMLYNVLISFIDGNQKKRKMNTTDYKYS